MHVCEHSGSCRKKSQLKITKAASKRKYLLQKENIRQIMKLSLLDGKGKVSFIARMSDGPWLCFHFPCC